MITKLRNFVLIFCIFFTTLSCSSSNSIDEVAAVDLNKTVIKAGNVFRLVPQKREPLRLSGKDISTTHFEFECTLQTGDKNVEYTSGVSFQAGIATETQSPTDFTQWPANVSSKKITIDFTLMPTLHTYSGSGFLYIYLMDKQKNCISNIIKWPVKFT